MTIQKGKFALAVIGRLRRTSGPPPIDRYRVLLALAVLGGTARRHLIDRTAGSPDPSWIASRLVSEGLLERAPDPRTGREGYKLTPLGENELKEFLKD